MSSSNSHPGLNFNNLNSLRRTPYPPPHNPANKPSPSLSQHSQHSQHTSPYPPQAYQPQTQQSGYHHIYAPSHSQVNSVASVQNASRPPQPAPPSLPGPRGRVPAPRQMQQQAPPSLSYLPQSLNQQPLSQQPMQQQSIQQQTMPQQSMSQQSMSQQSMPPQPMNPQQLSQQSLGPSSMSQHLQQPLSQPSLGQQGLGPSSMGQQLQQQPMSQPPMTQSLSQQSLAQHPLGPQSLGPSSLGQSSLSQHSLSQSVNQRSVEQSHQPPPPVSSIQQSEPSIHSQQSTPHAPPHPALPPAPPQMPQPQQVPQVQVKVPPVQQQPTPPQPEPAEPPRDDHHDEDMETGSQDDLGEGDTSMEPKLLEGAPFVPRQPMGPMMSAPPEGGSFPTLEAVHKHVMEYCTSVGYAIVIGRSKKTVPGLKKVLFVCDRAGKPPRRVSPELRKRKTTSRKCECQFGFFAIEQRTQWTVRYRPDPGHLTHNHGPSESPLLHPAARKLDSKMVAAVKNLKDNGKFGIGVSQTLEILQQDNPHVPLLPRDIYNARAAINRNPHKVETDLAENRPAIYSKPHPSAEERIRADIRRELAKAREDHDKYREGAEKKIEELEAKLREKDKMIQKFEQFIDICNQRVILSLKDDPNNIPGHQGSASTS